MEHNDDCQSLTLTCFEKPEIGEQDAKETNQELDCKPEIEEQEAKETTQEQDYKDTTTTPDDHPGDRNHPSEEELGAGVVSCANSMHLLDARPHPGHHKVGLLQWSLLMIVSY